MTLGKIKERSINGSGISSEEINLSIVKIVWTINVNRLQRAGGKIYADNYELGEGTRYIRNN